MNATQRKNVEFIKTEMPTKYGHFIMYVWNNLQGKESVALVTPNLDVNKPVTIRIHSECLTGDIINSYLCDCGEQKEFALKTISKSENGIFIYDRQEGRGIGLFNKIKALNLQKDNQVDTYEANRILGFNDDERNYDEALFILNFFKVSKVNILTNNPRKIEVLEDNGIIVTKRIPIVVKPNKFDEKYILDKKILGGHLY